MALVAIVTTRRFLVTYIQSVPGLEIEHEKKIN
jgi:hypothetical protein